MAQSYKCRKYDMAQPYDSFVVDSHVPYAGNMKFPHSFGFGQRLKDARQAKKMTGLKLGEDAGERPGKSASKQTVSDWESERHYPKVDQLRMICLKLGVSADHLIFGDLTKSLPDTVKNAASAVESLSEEERLQLLTLMLGKAVADDVVEEKMPITRRAEKRRTI